MKFGSPKTRFTPKSHTTLILRVLRTSNLKFFYISPAFTCIKLCIQALSVLPIGDLSAFLAHLRISPVCLALSSSLRVSLCAGTVAKHRARDRAGLRASPKRASPNEIQIKKGENDRTTLLLITNDWILWFLTGS